MPKYTEEYIARKNAGLERGFEMVGVMIIAPARITLTDQTLLEKQIFNAAYAYILSILKTAKYKYRNINIDVYNEKMNQLKAQCEDIEARAQLSKDDPFYCTVLDHQNQWSNSTREIYTLARECLQDCFEQQELQAQASEANPVTAVDNENLKRKFIDISNMQQYCTGIYVDNGVGKNLIKQEVPLEEGKRFFTTVNGGDCGPHTIILSLLYAGLFQNQPRNLIVTILYNWYIAHANEVIGEGTYKLTDQQFKDFIIEYLNVKTKEEIIEFAKKYFEPRDIQIIEKNGIIRKSIGPTNKFNPTILFLARTARKAVRDFYMSHIKEDVSAAVTEDLNQNVKALKNEDGDAGENMFKGNGDINLEHAHSLLETEYGLLAALTTDTVILVKDHNGRPTEYQSPQINTKARISWLNVSQNDSGHYVLAFDTSDIKVPAVRNYDAIINALQSHDLEILRGSNVVRPAIIPSFTTIATSPNVAAPSTNTEQRKPTDGNKDGQASGQPRSGQLPSNALEQEEPESELEDETHLSRRKSAESPVTHAFNGSSNRRDASYSSDEVLSQGPQEISAYGPPGGYAIAEVAKKAFKHKDEPKQISNYYIQNEEGTSNLDVFYVPNKPFTDKSPKVCTIIPATPAKEPVAAASTTTKLFDVVFDDQGPDNPNYYHAVRVALELTNNKIAMEKKDRNNFKITVPDLSTREQAQQLFFAYLHVCEYDYDKYLRNKDGNAFDAYIKIAPNPNAQKALHEFFSNEQEFRNYLIKFLSDESGKEKENQDIQRYMIARDAFAKHLGYASPSSGFKAERGSTQKFFHDYNYPTSVFKKNRG